MHEMILAERDMNARVRIAASVRELAKAFDLDGDWSLDIQQKDLQAKALFEREATANFLEALLKKLEGGEWRIGDGKWKNGETLITATEVLPDLPAPVLDEAPRAKGKRKK